MIPLSNIFSGSSEMAQRMRAMDWASTPLGPVETWPQPLRVAVNICLASRSPHVLWWGPELTTFYNDAYRPSLGASKHPSLGKPGADVWPEVWPTIGPMLESVMADGESTWSEDQLLPLDRYGYLEEVFFTYSYSPIRLETGSVGGVFCVATETTTKVLGERRTRAARDLAAEVLAARSTEDMCERAAEVLERNTSDAPFALLYLLDHERNIAHLAASAGLPPGHPLAAPTVSLTPEEGVDADDAWLGARIAQCARSGARETIIHMDTWWRGAPVKAGAEMTPHTALLLPIIEPGQSAPSAVLVAGVSPMRALDDEYEGFFELLTHHLAAGLASAHAHEEERRRAEALAEIDRAKTIFFSNVSHEFRTPLTLLLGPIADSLADTEQPLPARQRERLNLMNRNALRLLKLVNTLLDFARIEAGRAQAVYEPTDLAASTTELASAFRSLVEHAGMRLVVDCPPLLGEDGRPALVAVDRQMWEKIVLNLLSNAFKFTFQGEIAVSLRRVGANVELVVRDTGTGIPAEELSHLFERFHRVQGAQSRSYEGSGIGLALTQELVRLHAGAISVASAPGQGTTFTVTIPMAAQRAVSMLTPAENAQAMQASTALGAASFVEEAWRWLPDATEEALAEAPGWPREDLDDGRGALPAGAQAGPRARILLVDDNADLRDYLRRLLAERYDVEVASDGAEALAAALTRTPDLVLTDVMMPELDGFGLLRALRNDPRTQAIPIILLSARAGEEATIEGLEAGADDYLVKPFSAREALARVEGRLEMARLRREALAKASQLEAIFAAMTDGVAVYDPEGHILQANDAFRALAERVVGAEVFAENLTQTLDRRAALAPFLDPDGQPLPRERWPQARILAGETLEGASAAEMAFDAPEGRLHISVSGAPLRGPDGAPSGALIITRDVTERRRLERDVAERASLLEAVFNAAPDHMAIFDADGTIVQLNQMARTLAGPQRAHARLDEMGRMYDVRTPDGSPYPTEELPLTRALRGEVVTGAELRQRDAEGHDQTILAGAAPYYDDAGRVRGAVSVAHDITDLRRAERAARWQAHALERAHDAIFMWELGGPITYWNRGAELLYGFSRDEALGQITHALLCTRLPIPRADFEAALARAGEWTGELSHTTRDGREIVALSRQQVLREADGRLFVLETSHDITERRREEQRTHETMDALLAMAQTLVAEDGADTASASARQGALPVAQRLAALTRTLLGCNRVSITACEGERLLTRAVAIVGLSQAQEAQWWEEQRALNGRPVGEGMQPADLRRLLDGDTAIYDLTRPPYYFPNLYGVTAILAAPMLVEGRLVGLLSLDFEDSGGGVHHFSDEEERIALGVARLGALALERDHLQREREAARARALALTQANERMDEFMGIASHELRTPLTSVTANVQMAERQLKPGRRSGQPQQERADADTPALIQGEKIEKLALLLQRAGRQLLRLDRLVGDLLDASRIHSGNLELRRERCDLLGIVREGVEAQRAAWPDRVITLSAPCHLTMAFDLDPDRIGQVVTNYLTNALKYSAPDQPVAARVRTQGAGVRVEVSDHGVGLTPEQQERLFERFYRAPGVEEQSGSGVGLGLGLYICKSIVERHGGEVGVESAPGVGSVFWFTLPGETGQAGG